jgi:hypothetical protein
MRVVNETISKPSDRLSCFEMLSSSFWKASGTAIDISLPVMVI